MTSAGRPRNVARDFAVLNGDKFYEGSPCWCGNTKRYTRGGRCVDCAVAQARVQSAAKRKPKPPKLATPEQRRIVGKHPALAAPYGVHEVTSEIAATAPMDPISQQIAEIAAQEEAKAAEETARAEKIAAIRRIETGGLTLCGVAVTSEEMAGYIRTGIVPNRIMQGHDGDK